jgi:hypothetical protein
MIEGHMIGADREFATKRKWLIRTMYAVLAPSFFVLSWLPANAGGGNGGTGFDGSVISPFSLGSVAAATIAAACYLGWRYKKRG